MANRPSVLVLDDGELDVVHRVLREMGVDVVRLKGADIGRSVDAPLDVLITAGKRTLNDMPALVPAMATGEGPVWVCIHNQDFLPMRDRLREMGVHYLLQNALDEDSRRRFLMELLRKGSDRRRSPRLPVGGDIEYGTEGPSESAKLVELAVDGCRILTRESFEPGTAICVRLPASLAGGEELDLEGSVPREADPTVYAGHDLFETAVVFDALPTEKRALVESAIRGERIGTRLSVLSEAPRTDASSTDTALSDRAITSNRGPNTADATDTSDSDAAPSALAPPDMSADVDPVPDTNRRAAPRHSYERAVQILGEGDATLGCDLSLSGVRVADGEGLEDGARLSVALFGEAREEPIIIEAAVIRATLGAGTALRFDPLSPSQQAAIEKLLRQAPILDALDQPSAEAGRTVLAELRAPIAN